MTDLCEISPNASSVLGTYKEALKEGVSLPDDFLCISEPDHSQLPTTHDVIKSPVDPSYFDILQNNPASSGNMMSFDHTEITLKGVVSVDGEGRLVPDPEGEVIFSISAGENHSLSWFTQHVAYLYIVDLKSHNVIEDQLMRPSAFNRSIFSAADGERLPVPFLPFGYSASLFETPGRNDFISSDGDFQLRTRTTPEGDVTVKLVYGGEQEIDLKFALKKGLAWGDGFREKEGGPLRGYRAPSFPNVDLANSYFKVDGRVHELKNAEADAMRDVTVRNPQQKHNWDWNSFTGYAVIDGVKTKVRLVPEGVNSLRAGARQPQKGSLILAVGDNLHRVFGRIEYVYDRVDPTRRDEDGVAWRVRVTDDEGELLAELVTREITDVHDKSSAWPMTALVDNRLFSGWGNATAHVNIPDLNLVFEAEGRSYLESDQFLKRLTDDSYDAETKAFEATWKDEYETELPPMRSLFLATEVLGRQFENAVSLIRFNPAVHPGESHGDYLGKLIAEDWTEVKNYIATSFPAAVLLEGAALGGGLRNYVQAEDGDVQAVRDWTNAKNAFLKNLKRAYCQVGPGYLFRRQIRFFIDNVVLNPTPLSLRGTTAEFLINQCKPYPEFDAVNPIPVHSFRYAEPVCDGDLHFHARTLRAEVYLPDSSLHKAPEGGYPLIHLFHGGAFVLGNKRSIHDRVLAKYYTDHGYAVVTWDLPQAFRTLPDLWGDKKLTDLIVSPIANGMDKFVSLIEAKQLPIRAENSVFMGVSGGGFIAHYLASRFQTDESYKNDPVKQPSQLFLFSAPSDPTSVNSIFLSAVARTLLVSGDPLAQTFTGNTYVFHGESDSLIDYGQYDAWLQRLENRQGVLMNNTDHGSLNLWTDRRAQEQMGLALSFMQDVKADSALGKKEQIRMR